MQKMVQRCEVAGVGRERRDDRPLRVRIIASIILRVLNVRVQERAASRLRAQQVVLTCNHVSFLDGVIVACASPVPLAIMVTPRHAVEHRFTSRGIRMLERLGFGRAVPADIRSPFGVRAVLRAAQEGHSVLIFPEGRISPDGTQKPALRGAEWLAARVGVPTVEAHIAGAEDSRLFAPVGRRWRPRISLTL